MSSRMLGVSRSTNGTGARYLTVVSGFDPEATTRFEELLVGDETPPSADEVIPFSRYCSVKTDADGARTVATFLKLPPTITDGALWAMGAQAVQALGDVPVRVPSEADVRLAQAYARTAELAATIL